MVETDKTLEAFACGCCGRRRPASQLADVHLGGQTGAVEPVCRQCEDFLAQGLASLVEQVATTGRRVLPGAFAPGRGVRPASTRPLASRSIPAMPFAPPKRTASSAETELLALRYQVLEGTISGFIRGLEAAGLDRKRLGQELNNALNTLLRLRQTFADERVKIATDGFRPARSDIRRLLRHMDESALTVEEYLRFVGEELSVGRPQRDQSRPCRPPT